MPEREMTADDPLKEATGRVMRPVVRLLIARGVRFREAVEWLKDAYLIAAERHFQLEARRLTDSRLSLLTGLQRKDIKAIRTRKADEAPMDPGAGPLPRIIARWRSVRSYLDKSGKPAILPRSDSGVASFDRLVSEVNTDIHPRSILDEMQRLALVDVSEDGVELKVNAFVTQNDDEIRLNYLGANLGDHARVCTENALAEGAAPHFERAAHYNRLSATAVSELDALARRLQQETLEKISARAMELQDVHGKDPKAKGRIRVGAYVLAIQDGEGHGS